MLSCGAGNLAKYSHWAAETYFVTYCKSGGEHTVDTTPRSPVSRIQRGREAGRERGRRREMSVREGWKK